MKISGFIGFLLLLIVFLAVGKEPPKMVEKTTASSIDSPASVQVGTQMYCEMIVLDKVFPMGNNYFREDYSNQSICIKTAQIQERSKEPETLHLFRKARDGLCQS